MTFLYFYIHLKFFEIRGTNGPGISEITNTFRKVLLILVIP